MCRLNPQAAAKPCSHIMCNCGPAASFNQLLLSSNPVKRHCGDEKLTVPKQSFIQNINLIERKPQVFTPIILQQNIMVKSEPIEEPKLGPVNLPRLPSFESVLKSINVIQPEEKPAEDPRMLETLNFLFTQQKTMVDMTRQEDDLEKTLLGLTQELAVIKSNLERKIKNSQVQEQQQASDNKLVATSDMLLAQMYPKNPEFLYSLQVVGDFPQQLSRERPFNLTLELVDLRSGAKVSNPNKIEVSLALYTAANPPKLISINTTGERPFKGETNCQLTSGSVTFTKVYPNEVSSHYMTGCVFLVAFPKFTSEYADKMKFVSKYCGEVMVDPSLVRPWILDRLVIKAKKSKKE